MRSFRIVVRWLSLVVLLAIPLSNVPPATGQVRIPSEALVNVAELDDVFRVGAELEQQRRWGEALSHYEKARKEFPGQRDLEQRLTAARFHYELVRRYADTSFLKAVRTTNPGDAADLYGEVLLKIHAHYVHRPDWNRLLQRGLTGLEVAIAEPTFAERNKLHATETLVADTLNEMRRYVEMKPAFSRHDARQRAIEIAGAVERRLQLPSAAVLLEFCCAAVSSLDDYSAFLTGGQLDDVLSQIEGNFVGLGIELKAADQALLIVSVIPRGPAEQAGVVAGDKIIEVDGQSTRKISTDAAADMLKGAEGSVVDLVLENREGVPRRLRLVRKRVDVPSVDKTAIIDQDFGIGYFHLASFQKTTNRDVDAALWKLHQQGMRSLIMDLRGNPGGLLTASVEVADKFISNGAIVSTRGRSTGEDFDYQAHGVGTWRVPLIVLIDGDSASASEILAGAIHDHRRGTIVGTRSYGKGSVQGIFPLSVVNAGVRLTTAKFYSPSGQPISGRGVDPDFVVRKSERRVAAKPANSELPIINDTPDVVLNAGLQAARRQLTQSANAGTDGQR